MILSPVAQWWHGPILQGLARLTSCSPEEKLSVAKTWPDMLLPVATPPGPSDGQGPLTIAIVPKDFGYGSIESDTVLFWV